MDPNLIREQGHAAAGVEPGQILLGKYRIERVLGMGGMGVVVAATHVTLEERVAIKFLLPQALANNEAVARFLREARAAVRIKSEHVARVTDVGTLENGAPYMIMEYLDGADLATTTLRRGALPVEEAVEYVLQACEALAEAHAIGIVHRDLKPANLFLAARADGSPSVKVLDFGISKVSGLSSSGSDLSMTKTTTVMGSPLYMSPEQMASAREVNARTDVWALGAILYELLTGRVPFQADTITQLCAMILQQQAPPLRNLRPDAPEGLQVIISRCLEKDRNLRYANVAEFAVALTPFAPRRARISIERVSRVIAGAGLGTSRPGPDDAMPASSQHGSSTRGAWGGTGAGARSHGKLVAILVGALVGLVGVAIAAVVMLRSHVEPEPTDSAAPAVAPPPAATVGQPPAPIVVEPVPTPSATPSASATEKPTKPAPVAAKPVRPSKPRPTATPTPTPTPKPAPAAPAPKPQKPEDLYGDRK